MKIASIRGFQTYYYYCRSVLEEELLQPFTMVRKLWLQRSSSLPVADHLLPLPLLLAHFEYLHSQQLHTVRVRLRLRSSHWPDP